MIHRSNKLLNKIWWFFKDLILGIHYDYSLCCIIDFVVDNFRYPQIRTNRIIRNEILTQKSILIGRSVCEKCFKKLV